MRSRRSQFDYKLQIEAKNLPLSVMCFCSSPAEHHHADDDVLLMQEDFDYRMFEDDAAGVVIDRVLEPRHKHDSHHHHHHHHHKGDKRYLKTNRVQGLKKFFEDFRL
ncbi:unnamed protein product [Nippostrongylus brasiliensis]|uniref:IAA-alanine resistance protein 1 n=1 Tax=Nippostrongylus brasiliensis TaxID=27835 RepID=A0A158R2C1_NIPBR|nr:unnamed protein product [Nippostrongylus brasiliensis]